METRIFIWCWCVRANRSQFVSARRPCLSVSPPVNQPARVNKWNFWKCGTYFCRTPHNWNHIYTRVNINTAEQTLLTLLALRRSFIICSNASARLHSEAAFSTKVVLDIHHPAFSLNAFVDIRESSNNGINIYGDRAARCLLLLLCRACSPQR